MIGILHRLLAASQVNDAEASVAESDIAVAVNAPGIGTTMPDRINHVLDELSVRGLLAEVQNACNATHGIMSACASIHAKN